MQIGIVRMRRTALLACALFAACEYGTEVNVGLDPILVVVLVAAAFAGGWFAHKKHGGGE